MAERSPLRHGRHLHQAEWNTDDRAENQRDGNPFVLNNPVVQERSAHRQSHANFPGPYALPGRAWLAHQLERQNEKKRCNQVYRFDDLVRGERQVHGFCGRLVLNMRSMRSVIKNPPTMLLVAATMAMVPSTVA